jgi:hypothetical protein
MSGHGRRRPSHPETAERSRATARSRLQRPRGSSGGGLATRRAPAVTPEQVEPTVRPWRIDGPSSGHGPGAQRVEHPDGPRRLRVGDDPAALVRGVGAERVALGVAGDDGQVLIGLIRAAASELRLPASIEPRGPSRDPRPTGPRRGDSPRPPPARRAPGAPCRNRRERDVTLRTLPSGLHAKPRGVTSVATGR